MRQTSTVARDSRARNKARKQEEDREEVFSTLSGVVFVLWALFVAGAYVYLRWPAFGYLAALAERVWRR